MSSGRSLATKGVGRGGVTFSTKGLIDELTVALPVPRVGGERFAIAQEENPTVIVVPTAHNLLLFAVENIIANLRVQQPANLELPSMYKRAYLIAYETDEIAVVKP